MLAWLVGSIAGWGWGLSIIGPSRSLIGSTILGMPSAAGWGTALVVGIPIGTWLSARAHGPIAWGCPGREELTRRFTGGMLMGIGGTLATGCNIGNALGCPYSPSTAYWRPLRSSPAPASPSWGREYIHAAGVAHDERD